MTSLATRPVQNEISLLPKVGPMDLFAALLADSRSPNTRAGRDHDCRAFARFLSASTPAAALALLISGGRATGNAISLAFRSFEVDRGSAAATVNRKLATLRRAVKLACRFDLIEWRLEVDDLRVAPFRDCRGPALEEWRQVWAFAVACGDNPQARRNRALLRLLYDSALRKSEAIGLDVADLDLAGSRVQIKGKGHADKSWITISAICCRLLREWMASRGDASGPVFTSHVRRDASADSLLMAQITVLRDSGLEWSAVANTLNVRGRRTGSGLPWTANRLEKYVGRELATPVRLPDREVNRILAWISTECGLDRKVKPHGLRHCSITRALDLTSGDVRRVQRFARHASPKTTVRYDDSRVDMAGEITAMVSADGC